MLHTTRASLETYLARIAVQDPQIKAWVWHDPEQVREQFNRLPENATHLPLFGVPVGVKDIIDTVDMPTEYGSRAFKGHRPNADAAVVARLKAAGALIMGKTVSTEFAHVHAGPTLNPHNLAHSPGGSSSGSAAAVAAGMVPLAFGTQTGGSTIRPSAYCGIVGFKPSYGLISLAGVNPLAPSMDTIGIHAGDVADAAVLYSVLRGQTMPPIQQNRALTIGWFPGPHADKAAPESHAALALARKILSSRDDVQVVEVHLPSPQFGDLSEGNRLIMAYEAALHHRAVYEQKGELLGAATRKLIETGMAISEADYEAQRAHVLTCRALFAPALRQVDALLTFSAPGEAPLVEQGTGDSTFNRAWTIIGAPCLTLPLTKGPRGLPIGVQLVAAVGEDFKLLQIGAQLERILAHRAI
jgi:Asp-tRNA(Asn)/Glu-tRNA(Gln) amidotransferase A subunit family amidase